MRKNNYITSRVNFILAQDEEKCNSVEYTVRKAEEIKRKTKNISYALVKKYRSSEKLTKAENIKNCGSFLMFKEFKDIDKTTFLHKANFCKHSLCPLCAWRKSLKDYSILEKTIEMIRNDFFNIKIYHLVLAIPNVKTITKALLSELKRKAVYFIKNYINTDNYYTSLEITYSEETGFHPHLHILLAVNDFIKVSESFIYKMAMEWKKVYNKQDIKYKSYTFYITGIKGTELHELTKYILKVNKIDDLEECILTTDFVFELKGVRKNSAGGIFKEYIPKAKQKIRDDFELTKLKMSSVDYIYRIFEYIMSAEMYSEKN